jgi:hypothetical protein
MLAETKSRGCYVERRSLMKPAGAVMAVRDMPGQVPAKFVHG